MPTQPRKQLERIRKATKWFQRTMLARDAIPICDALPIFEASKITFGIITKIESGDWLPHEAGADAAKESISIFGREMVERIANCDAEYFDRLAADLRTIRSHKPRPDNLRSALAMICIPPTKTFGLRWILDELAKQGIAVDETSVRRACADLRIKIKGIPGRPRNPSAKHKKK